MNFSKKAISLAGILLIVVQSLPAQVRQTREEYIDRYKSIAVAHMERYGIPASITMAQGILESDCGNSWLSLQSNNHSASSANATGRATRSITTTTPRGSASAATPRSRRRTGIMPNFSIRSRATTRCSPTRPTITRAGRGDSKPPATPRHPTTRNGSRASSRRTSSTCSTGPTASGSTPRAWDAR